MMSDKKLGIVVATYNQAIDGSLQSLVYSLVAQSDQNFHCYVVYDGPPDYKTLSFMESIMSEHSNFSIHSTDIKSKYTWGHESRNVGVALCKEPYLTHANGDNLYFKDYVKFVNEAIEEGTDVITLDIVHNYWAYIKFGGGKFGRDNGVGDNKSDFMNFVVKTSIAKTIPFKIYEHDADMFFCEDVKSKYPQYSSLHIDAILAVHQ